MTDPAFFRRESNGEREILLPEPLAGSGWGTGAMRGMPISGALARATEQLLPKLGLADMVPSRFTLDLFRPAFLVPTVVTARVVRQGRRLCLIDAILEQDGRPAARSSTLFLKASQSPEGGVWHGDAAPELPPREMHPIGVERRLYFTQEAGWGQMSTTEPTPGRKQSWHFAMPIVEGEPPTPFQMAAAVADVANVVSNWGSQGLEFINADVTLALARLPLELEFGVSALDRVESDGISVGTAQLFDRGGVFGTTTVVALANAEHAVDPRAVGRRGELASQRNN